MKFLVISNHSYMLWQFRRQLIEALLNRGEVILSMPFVGHEDDLAAMGCRCIDTPIDRRGMDLKTDAKLYLCYHTLIKAESPDMVITYSVKPNIYAGFVCRQLRIPYFANVQGLGTAFRKKLLSVVVSLMYRVALKRSNGVFFENSPNADEFISRRIIKRSNAIILNGAGVDLNHYQKRSFPDNGDTKHFLFIGRIMREKGIDELFEAAVRLKTEFNDRFILHIVGFFEDEYEQQVDRLSRNGVIVFHGFQEDTRPFYADADCVVLPSYHEGMSNVLLEAASMGRPIITSDIPGCREAVTDGNSGFLCNAHDAESLYEKMKAFMHLSREECCKMGDNGRRLMEMSFSKDFIVEETLKALGV